MLLCIKTKWCDPLQAAEQKKLFFWHSNIQENSKSGTVCVTAESPVLVSHRLLLCALWQNTVHRWTKTEEGKGHTCVGAIRPVYTLYVLLWPHPSQLTSPCIHPLLLTEGRRIKVVSWTVILFEFRSVPISSNHSHQLRATKMRATRRRRRQMCTFAGICSVYNQSALVCRFSRVFLVSVICLQLRLDLSDLLAFVRMKHYAMALPNVPIEISSLSPLDAGWAAEIKRLQSMRSHFTWQRMFIQVICPCEEQWRDSGCANNF